MGRQAGFTLIELLVVLVILAVVTSLVVPPLNAAFGLGRLRAETANVTTALREARSTALLSGQVIDFVADEPRGWRVGEQRHTLSAGVALSLDVPPAGIGRDGSTVIRFFANGQSTGGRLTLAEDESRRVVVVDWLTGRVREE